MAENMQTEIAQINAAIASGGGAYWRIIYRRYFPGLAVFIQRDYGPMPSDIAEDLSYRTLMKLITARTRPRFTHTRQFTSWLFKAARCTALDYWKSLKGKMDQATHSVDAGEDMFVNLPDDQAPGELHARVQAAMARLNQAEQSLLSMRANGTPYSVIAEDLGIKENVARTRFGRAKKKFIAQFAMLHEECHENQSQGIYRAGQSAA
jgi:RNA polymerase sigma factor (sigma-70 family)